MEYFKFEGLVREVGLGFGSLDGFFCCLAIVASLYLNFLLFLNCFCFFFLSFFGWFLGAKSPPFWGFFLFFPCKYLLVLDTSFVLAYSYFTCDICF